MQGTVCIYMRKGRSVDLAECQHWLDTREQPSESRNPRKSNATESPVNRKSRESVNCQSDAEKSSSAKDILPHCTLVAPPDWGFSIVYLTCNLCQWNASCCFTVCHKVCRLAAGMSLGFPWARHSGWVRFTKDSIFIATFVATFGGHGLLNQTPTIS